MQAAFSRLSQGKTVIMIAHRLSTIAHVDQIYVLKDGEIVENGTSGELLAQEGEFRKNVEELSDFRAMESGKGGLKMIKRLQKEICPVRAGRQGSD